MRSIMMRLFVAVLVLGTFAVAGEKPKIGFSELNIADPWRIAQVDSMQKVAKDRGYQMITTNAELKAEKQISDVEDLLTQGVEFLFIAPMDVEAIVPALTAARAKKVPVILLDRQAKGVWPDDFLTTIIADYVKQGRECAKWLANKLGKDAKIRVVEITGRVGGSDVRDRAAGFREGMAGHPNMEIIASQSGDWSRAEAQKITQNIIQSTGGNFNAIYCHNDEMALGVVLALRAAGLQPDKDVYVLAIDGQKEAVEAIIDGDISAIYTCNPRFGPAAFDALERHLASEKLPEFIINTEYMIDGDNAEEKLADAF